ncbi:MAG: [NiFe]-hydrogenase assembly chaperone HybE [Betaproteobacteria bacterium]|nr:[NiFe]-hydrogenase assembly chaperone HybE [Betaproteobacteria bacterium]
MRKGGAHPPAPTVAEESLPFPKGGQEGFRPASPDALVAGFRHIAATRMTGVSLVNPALRVEAVGFREINGYTVGVLITPWCMNLIGLPGAETEWMARGSGTKHDLTLPSGDYEFLTAHEDNLGPYLSASLFSPLFEFGDMDQARAVAQAVLAEIFNPPGPEPLPQGFSAKLDQPVSRRGFLGALLGNRP